MRSSSGTPARFAGRQLGRLLAHPGHFTLLAEASGELDVRCPGPYAPLRTSAWRDHEKCLFNSLYLGGVLMGRCQERGEHRQARHRLRGRYIASSILNVQGT